MNARHRTIWVLLIFIALVSIIFAGVKLVPANKKWQKAKDRAANVRFGTDKELEGVIKYLEKRKLTKKEVVFFKIGYAPPQHDFYEKLKMKGIILRSTEDGYKIKNMLRLTIGSQKENLRFMNVTKSIFRK